jgi:hypothetical protein
MLEAPAARAADPGFDAAPEKPPPRLRQGLVNRAELRGKEVAAR